MLNYFLLKPFAAFIPNFKVFAESQTQKLPRFELLYQWHYNPPQNRFGKVKKKITQNWTTSENFVICSNVIIACKCQKIISGGGTAHYTVSPLNNHLWRADCWCRKIISGGETGYYIASPLNFEIFLKLPDLLSS